ncbi:enoyl-[acyl-carrier-protein] reductase [NADH], chloroplastic [Trifolium repens]|nr:enoyl-[acyl-carrier-protein] reductase [NADH], chloroplastic [Trifolium repens]
MVLDNLKNALFKVRSGKDKGEWIDEDRLKELRDEWKDEKWQNISKINTQNRKSKAGHNVHSGGSISAREHAKKMIASALNLSSISFLFMANFVLLEIDKSLMKLKLVFTGNVVGDADSVFEEENEDEDADGEDPEVNVGNSAGDGENEFDGAEFDGEESDYGAESDSDNTSVDDDEVNESTDSDQNPEELFIIDDVDDIVKIDILNLDTDAVSKLQFGSLLVAYKFYCWFAKMNGFTVRKGQIIKNKAGVVVQQTFLCNLQGFRQDVGLTVETHSLVLNRWSMFSKESIRGNYEDDSHYWDSHLVARRFNSKYCEENGPDNVHVPDEVENIINPHCSRTKGGPSANTRSGIPRRPNSCTRCNVPGHNRRSCTQAATVGEVAAGSYGQSMSDGIFLPYENVLNYDSFAVKKDFGTIDILVQSLANGPEVSKLLFETSRKGYLAALSASSYSYISLLKHFLPIINPGGASLSLTYIASERIILGYVGYAKDMLFSKAALESDTRVLAFEAGRKKRIRVNTISERLGYELAKWLGIQTPGKRVCAVIYVDNGLNAMGVGVNNPIFKDLDIPKDQH